MSAGIYYYLLVITLFLHHITCSFYHEPSRILLQSADHLSHNETDFGFAIEYQKGSTNKLIIGAPRYELDGRVYTCRIDDCLKNDTVTCSPVDINIQELASTNRSVNPNQHFYLGASIAATDDYFLTCAPLWTLDKRDKEDGGMYGTCFIYNNTAYRYDGLVEQKLKNGQDVGPIFSGYGWNVLADEVNGYLLITKPVVYGDILTVPYNNPLDPAKSSWKVSFAFKSLIERNFNIAYAVVAGQFLEDYTMYAFSYTTAGNNGEIAFLRHFRNGLQMLPIRIKRREIGSMFGASLCSSDIDLDGHSDLLVGAPTHIDILEDQEVGAVHIYSLTKKDTRINIDLKGTIFGDKEGGRFGTAIAANDIDGDKYPEIFISAIYENNNGAVYIISGAEINDIITNAEPRFIHLSDLHHTQRITGDGHQRFGFSIKIVPDIDENGCNDLAVGSPGDSFVSLYRCLSKVHVKMNASLIGSQVSERADKFDVTVCVYITYQEKPTKISSKLLVTTNIIGEGAFIPKPTFVIDMSKKEKSFCKNITVNLDNHDPANYKFTAELDLHNETYEMLKEKDFDSTWAVLSPYSTRSKSLNIVRRCNNDCSPILSMDIEWIGKVPYQLGSSEVENINITVKNTGHNSYGACIWIGLEGAKVNRLECPKDDTNTGYLCLMPKPLRMYKDHVVNVLLNMSRAMSTDEKLDIDVKLYEDCDKRQKAGEQKNITIPYYVKADNVFIYGSSAVRNISDKELNNVKVDSFDDYHEYLVINNGTVHWIDLQVLIKIKQHTFIIDYVVSSPDNDKGCIRHDMSGFAEFNCTFDLKPGVTKKFMAIACISRERLKDLFKEMNVSTSSEASLYFPSIEITKNESISTTINFKKELTVGDNKLMIIIIGVLLALAILLVIVIVLYKYNFFQRKQKKKLEDLKDTWRRKAIRKSASGTSRNSQTQSEVVENDQIEMEVIEDPFDEIPIGSGDGVHLIEEKAQVHCSS